MTKETLGWIINIGASVGWLINVKHRKYAMMFFTIITLLSIWYFWSTAQTPFLLRSFYNLGIDVATLYHIFTKEKTVNVEL